MPLQHFSMWHLLSRWRTPITAACKYCSFMHTAAIPELLSFGWSMSTLRPPSLGQARFYPSLREHKGLISYDVYTVRACCVSPDPSIPQCLCPFRPSHYLQATHPRLPHPRYSMNYLPRPVRKKKCIIELTGWKVVHRYWPYMEREVLARWVDS